MTYKYNPFTDNFDYSGDEINNRVIVKKPEDLQNIDSSKLYFIDGFIDMGAQQIEIPQGGFFCTGLGYFVSGLYSSEDNYTLFVNKPGEYAGNSIMQGLTLLTSGINSQIFNLDNQENFGAIEFNSVNFGDFFAPTTSCGTLSNYRQFRVRDWALINCNEGLTFDGTWSGGMRIFESILLFLNPGCTAFKAGPTLSIEGSCVSDINAVSSIGNNNNVVFDFSPANIVPDWGFNLSGARFQDTYNPLPNMPLTSTKRFSVNCRGVKNTRVGAGWYLSTEANTPLTLNTPAKLNGVTTYNSVIHFLTNNDNEFTYNSTVNDDFFVSGFVTLEGSPDRIVTIQVRKWNALLSSYEIVETFTKYIINVVGNVDIGSYSIGTPVELNKNDRIELWAINETDNTDVILQEGSYLRVRRES